MTPDQITAILTAARQWPICEYAKACRVGSPPPARWCSRCLLQALADVAEALRACPFCATGSFDQPGLAVHLVHCEAFFALAKDAPL
jgi:hypothetical protein